MGIYTEEQLEFKKLMGDFMRKEVEPYKNQWDEEGYFPVETYKKAFSLGLHTLEIPEEYGGAALDHQTMALMYEEAGYWDAGFAMSMMTSAVQPLKAVVMFGSEEQKQWICFRLSIQDTTALCPRPMPIVPAICFFAWKI